MAKYFVNDIYPCFQGEGVNMGLPMIMLRLQGCDVGCPWCDTKETWYMPINDMRVGLKNILGQNPRYTQLTSSEIAEYILATPPLKRFIWVLISGGEPGQQDLRDLCIELKLIDAMIAIETSGTAPGVLGTVANWITCSPKVGMPGGKEIIPDVIKIADELKFVIGKQSDVEDVEEFLSKYQTKEEVQVCLQPVSLSEKATQICLKAIMNRAEHFWRISIQTHKLVNAR